MAAYRVGVALLREAERQVAWVESKHPELQPVRVPGGSDGLVRLILTYHATSEAAAVEHTAHLFDRASQAVGDDVSPSKAGPLGIHAWKLGDDPPAEYRRS